MVRGCKSSCSRRQLAEYDRGGGRPQGFGTRVSGARGLEETEEAHECAACQGGVCGHARLLEGCGAEESASRVRSRRGTRRIPFALRRRGRRRSARDGAHEWGQGGAFRQLGRGGGGPKTRGRAVGRL